MANLNVKSVIFQIEYMKRITREIIVLEFDQDKTPEQAIDEARKQDLHYSTHDDAVYFGIDYPHVAETAGHSVVFLHEGFTDSEDYPYRICLGRRTKSHGVDVFNYEKFRAFRYAFVRK